MTSVVPNIGHGQLVLAPDRLAPVIPGESEGGAGNAGAGDLDRIAGSRKRLASRLRRSGKRWGDERNFESMALQPGANDETDTCVVVHSRRPIEIAEPDSLSKTSRECYTTVKPQYEWLVRPRGLA